MSGERNICFVLLLPSFVYAVELRVQSSLFGDFSRSVLGEIQFIRELSGDLKHIASTNFGIKF